MNKWIDENMESHDWICLGIFDTVEIHDGNNKKFLHEKWVCRKCHLSINDETKSNIVDLNKKHPYGWILTRSCDEEVIMRVMNS